MRSGELLAVNWVNVNLEKRTIFLSDTKNGSSRTVPLSTRALNAIQALPRSINGRLFSSGYHSIHNAFRLAVTKAQTTQPNLTGKEMGRFTRLVKRIENGFVYISNGEKEEIMTKDGGKVLVVSSATSFSYDPPKLEVPGDYLVVGKRWSGAYVETDETSKRKFFREDKFHILSQQEIAVPAGKYVAFKIEDSAINQFGTKISLIYWIVPGYGLPIRTDRVNSNSRANINVNETVELVAVRRQKTATN